MSFLMKQFLIFIYCFLMKQFIIFIYEFLDETIINQIHLFLDETVNYQITESHITELSALARELCGTKL
jgi:hypothetical protein